MGAASARVNLPLAASRGLARACVPLHRAGVGTVDSIQARALRRAALREGFEPPGPKAAAPESLTPAADETLDALAGDWRIFQLRQGHRYSADDLLVAHFAGETARGLGLAPRRLLDLGAGIGSVGLMTLWQFPDAHLTMVEAQARSRALAAKSSLWNGVQDRVEVLAGDLREVAPRSPDFDVVTGSPPYFDAAAGVVSALPQRAPCRFELRGGVEGYVHAMALALRLGGLGALVMTRAGLERIETAASGAGLVLLRRREVIFKAGRAPHLVLVALAHTGAFARAQPLPEDALVLRDERGERTPAFRAVRVDMGYPPRIA